MHKFKENTKKNLLYHFLPVTYTADSHSTVNFQPILLQNEEFKQFLPLDYVFQ